MQKYVYGLQLPRPCEYLLKTHCTGQALHELTISNMMIIAHGSSCCLGSTNIAQCAVKKWLSLAHGTQ
eukprot:scaffold307279_cov24-Prasinocladus_malaysianus.AAC.1